MSLPKNLHHFQNITVIVSWNGILSVFQARMKLFKTQICSLFIKIVSQWLVLLTFAAGSDVSVVIKYIQLVLCIFNRHSWSHESIICSWLYRFD